MRPHGRWQSCALILPFLTAVVVLLPTQAAAQGLASEVIAPVALAKASNLLPVSEAAFEELRAANAQLRASNAKLEQANSKAVAVLEAVQAKLKELLPGTPGTNGFDGMDGPTGPVGATGQRSVTGGTGFSGNAGKSNGGLSGNSGSGQAGLLGDTGDNGYKGESGRSGKSGASGDLGISGNTGVIGGKGTFGLSGVAGTTGATGITNAQGIQGDAASKGTSGNSGARPTGASGLSGSAALGTVGVTGDLGLTGNSGETGGTCYITLDFDDINTTPPGAPFNNVGNPWTYRGITFNGQGSNEQNIVVNSQQVYGTNYATHSSPNHLGAFLLSNGGSITLEDASGMFFAVRSLWLAGFFRSDCDEDFTISGFTNGGLPNPACVVPPFSIAGQSPGVQVVFDPPCVATSLVITAEFSSPGIGFCNNNLMIGLDDITVCPATS